MKTKIIRILCFGLALLILMVPIVSFAQGPLVTCKENCGFREFMELINRLIDFIFKYLALPIAALMFAYAGVLLVTSGGSSEKRGTAKHIFLDAVIGLVLATASWLIVKTFLSIMGYKDVGLFF